MKRFLHIIVAVLLLFATTGFTITKHYCSGNLVDVAINAMPDPCCDMGEACCTNESETFQLKENLERIQSVNLDNEISFDIQLIFTELLKINTVEIAVPISSFDKGIPPPDVTAFLADIQSFRL